MAVTAQEIRERVNLTESDVSDATVLRFARLAAITISSELGKDIDYLDCTDAEAEAIINIAAVYCKCKVVGGRFSNFTLRVGDKFSVGDLTVDNSSENQMQVDLTTKEQLQFLMDEAKRIIDNLRAPYVGSV